LASKVAIYDTTLRDGSQTEGVSFSTEDKLDILKRLDHFGVDYVEGGWPGSNPEGRGVLRSGLGHEAEACPPGGVRQHPPRWHHRERGPKPPDHPGIQRSLRGDLWQGLGPPCHQRAQDLAGRERRAGGGQRILPEIERQGGRVRRRALLRRLRQEPGLCDAGAGGGRLRRSGLADAVRHQWRFPAGPCDRGLRGCQKDDRSPDRRPCPQRLRAGSRQFPGSGIGRRHHGAGHHKRTRGSAPAMPTFVPSSPL